MRFAHGSIVLLALAFAASGLATAQVAKDAKDAKDNLWEVTTKMEMAGMSMQMPAQTSQVCLSKGVKEEGFVPRRDECKITDSKRVGPKFTYTMVCSGPQPMTINGEITTTPKSYDGRMLMKMKQEGKDMEMTQTFSGKLVGECASSK